MKSLIFILFLSVPIFANAQNRNVAACSLMIQTAMAMEVLSSNIANLETTRTPEGGPYKRQILKCSSSTSCEIKRESSFKFKYLPDHPDAEENGYVKYPNINAEEEIADMLAARKTFENAKRECEQGLEQAN